MNDIQGILLGLCLDLEDRLIWVYSKDDFFSLKSAYLLAKCLNLLNLSSHSCRRVWDAYTTPRNFFFFWWFISRKSIPTRVMLGSRGFNLCLTCEVCGNFDESIIHALRDCPGAKRVWIELSISSKNQEFYNLPLSEWLKSNCCSVQIFSWPRIPWKMLFP